MCAQDEEERYDDGGGADAGTEDAGEDHDVGVDDDDDEDAPCPRQDA